ncbi:ATPase [Helicobacter didelphidarum]|uniref:ATPase n=1 Tax=Helicobacter didelphidarum TaxID=2040648 RepID=A0A3D8IJ14_9HELI|nr:ATP-binding protein [Helicobacter didelphidarum]RDU65317.1 ATPase [Helicobacter didelphidarum]
MRREIPKIKKILPRNVNIFHNRTYIYGSPHSGKTLLALSYATNFSDVVYLNLDMLISETAKKNAREVLFTQKSPTQLFIIDNFYQDFLLHKEINIPCILIGNLKECPTGFTKVKVLGLSFEEYLSFDRKNLSIESLLSNFIKDGNNPEMSFLADFKKTERKWEIMKSALQDDFLLFYYMLSLQSLKVSIYGIYKYLKKYIKISKDRIYASIDSMHQNLIIHFCKHIHDFQKDIPNKKYKLYFYDFSLCEFSDSKYFIRSYENMVFLELLTMGFSLFYSDIADFIDREHEIIFLCVPFVSLEGICTRIEKIRASDEIYKNFRIIAISMNLNQEISTTITIIEFSNLSVILQHNMQKF